QFYQTLKKGAQLNKLEPGWVDAGPYGWVYLLKEDKLVTDKALQVMQLTKPIPDTDGPFVSLPFDGHIIHSGNKHPAQTERWLLATRCWGWNQGWKEDRTRADTAFHQAAKGHRAQASAAQVVACRPLDGDLAVEMQERLARVDTVARKVMELYTNQKGKDKTEYSDLQVQCLVGQGLVKPQAYDALTWCRKQEKLFRLQSLAAVFQHFKSQSHVRSQDDGG
ncbi:unnamed protein product, partial [Effrenium voratum]